MSILVTGVDWTLKLKSESYWNCNFHFHNFPIRIVGFWQNYVRFLLYSYFCKILWIRIGKFHLKISHYWNFVQWQILKSEPINIRHFSNFLKEHGFSNVASKLLFVTEFVISYERVCLWYLFSDISLLIFFTILSLRSFGVGLL